METRFASDAVRNYGSGVGGGRRRGVFAGKIAKQIPAETQNTARQMKLPATVWISAAPWAEDTASTFEDLAAEVDASAAQ